MNTALSLPSGALYFSLRGTEQFTHLKTEHLWNNEKARDYQPEYGGDFNGQRTVQAKRTAKTYKSTNTQSV